MNLCSDEQKGVREALNSIAPRLDPRADGIADLRRLSGGASQETWAFDLVGPEIRAPLVLRRASALSAQHPESAGLENEAAVISAVAGNNVPVPLVRYVLTERDGIGGGFISDLVSGETIARKILRDAEYDAVRPHLTHQFGQILGAIHSVDVKDLPPLRDTGARESLALAMQAVAELDHPRPVFEFAMRWLADRVPTEEVSKLVHGDFRNGNLIISSAGVQAVLDWELTHLGDPMEDLGWLCITPWRFGAVDAPVGGLGARQDLFDSYARATGCAVDPERVRWWEVMGSVRWGIACAQMAKAFRSGVDKSVERAMIARRASENEIDLLRVIVCGE